VEIHEILLQRASGEAIKGSEEPKSLCLQQNIWNANMQVSAQENEDLLRSFTTEELDAVLMDTKTDTAPGPDGLHVMFYKKFWMLIKKELLLILNGFALGTVDIARLNFGILSLIPKVPGAVNIKQFDCLADEGDYSSLFPGNSPCAW
jgi:hypothetical protein